MATGNIFLGTARKKLGDVVLYRSGGKQRSRIRVIPKNPKTAKQAVQRMVLATAAKMASAYEPIVNHSFEGTPVGAKSVQEFRKYAMYALRSAAAAYLNEQDADTHTMANFAIKGAPVVGGLEGLFLSRGSLGLNAIMKTEIEAQNYNCIQLQLSSALAATAFTTQEAYTAELRKLGIVPGDQLTFVALEWNPEDLVATATVDGNTAGNCAQLVRFCRVVFKAELPEEFSGTLLSGTAINPALIEESQGMLPAFSSVTYGGGPWLQADFSAVVEPGYELQSGTIIRSQKQDNGSFKYNSAHMVASQSNWGENDAWPNYLTYMDGAAEVNVGETLYLRHAVAAPFVQGE